MQYIAEADLHIRIPEAGVPQGYGQLREPGDGGRDGGAPYAEGRETAETVDQQGIHADIYAQGNQVYNGGYHDPLDVLDKHQVGGNKSHHRVGQGDNPKILCAVSDDLRVGGKDPHQHLRDSQSDNGKCDRRRNGDPDGDARHLFNGVQVLFSPVLGDEDAGAGADPEEDQVQDEEDLSRQGGPGEDIFTDASYHEDVRRHDAGVNQILERHGDA